MTADAIGGSRQSLRALVVSALAHGVVIMMAYAGQSVSPTVASRAGSPARAHVFSATLSGINAIAVEVSPTPSAAAGSDPLASLDASTKPEAAAAQPGEAGQNLLPTAGKIYYLTADLSKKPQPTKLLDLDPPEAKMILGSGKIILKLWINSDGEVIDVEVEKSELPGRVLKAAVAAFGRYRFIPGEKDGRKVGSIMRIELSYEDNRFVPH